jgi:hypothetical protein
MTLAFGRGLRRRQSATCAVALALATCIAAAAPAAAEDRIFTAAGTGAAGFGGDGGPAPQARIDHPRGLAVLPDGSYLVVDAGAHRVRRVLPNGTITTVAGTGTSGFSGDGGPATAARLNLPHAAAPLPDGGFLIADTNNYRIRRVSPAGIITTVAGIGVKGFSGDGGPAVAARISAPRGLASLPDGSYLIADSDNNRIRRVTAAGIISTVAGTGTSGFGGDGGSATSAAMNSPFGVAPVSDGGFLIADADNRRVRRVSAAGTITTVAGTGTSGFSGDGGPATSARITAPYNVAPLSDGGFLIADTANHRVRQVSGSGTISTVAGTGAAGFSGDGGPPTQAQLNSPKALLLFGSGYLIADADNHRVRSVQTSCSDTRAPVSYYSRGAGRGARRGRRLTLRGRVTERACGGIAGRVRKAAISIARVEGRGRCRHLGRSGRLGGRARCGRRRFLTAKLKSLGGQRYRWSFTVRRGLPRGTYLAQVRSVDQSRNLERRRQTRGSKRNVIRFRVR